MQRRARRRQDKATCLGGPETATESYIVLSRSRRSFPPPAKTKVATAAGNRVTIKFNLDFDTYCGAASR